MNRKEEKEMLDAEVAELERLIRSENWIRAGEPEDDIFEEPEEDEDEARYRRLNRQADEKKERIREIELEEDNEAKVANFAVDLKPEVAVIDKESDVDLLDRTPKAKALARLIANKQTIAPLAIGIYGKWGRGKSTFVGLIEESLEAINNEVKEKQSKAAEKYKKSHIIKFNPTEYDDHKMIWYSILKEVYIKYEAETKFIGRIRFTYRSLFPSMKNNIFLYLLGAILIASFMGVYFLEFDKYDSLIENIKNSKWYINIITAGLFITTATQLIVPLIKKIMFIIKPLSNKVLKQILIPDFKTKLGTREEVKQSLDKLIKIWLKKDENIILVVDELDRCSEKTIVEFFSALQLFVSSDSIIKVISMNEELVSLALANNNLFFLKDGATRDDKLAYGYEYLQKYISIPIRLKRHNDYKYFLENLLGQHLSFFGEEEKKIIVELINVIAKAKDITPREIKQILNLLVLSKETVITHFEVIKYKVTFVDYIKWFFVYYFNPIEAEFIIKVLKTKIYYNSYKYMKFGQAYSEIMVNIKGASNRKIKHLNNYLEDIKIEVIIAADKLIEKSLIR